MAKYFGEFLVESHIITNSDLIEALIDQHRNVPSVLEIVYQNKIMPEKTILEILNKSSEVSIDFISLGREMGFWSEEIGTRVISESKKFRRPLGHVLLSKGLIQMDQLILSLDEFLSQRMDEQISTLDKVDREKVEIKRNSVESDKNSSTESPDFLSYFTQDKYIELETLILSIEPLKKSFKQEIEQIIGAFSQFNESLLNSPHECCLGQTKSILKSLRYLEAKHLDLDEGLFWEFKAVTKGALDFLRDVNLALDKGLSEQEFLREEKAQSAYKLLLQDWESLEVKLS